VTEPGFDLLDWHSTAFPPIAMATRHAAGVCAALAAQTKAAPQEIAVRGLQRELLRQGARLRRELSELIEAQRPPCGGRRRAGGA
jgi:hypothetical protein